MKPCIKYSEYQIPILSPVVLDTWFRFCIRFENYWWASRFPTRLRFQYIKIYPFLHTWLQEGGYDIFSAFSVDYYNLESNFYYIKCKTFHLEFSIFERDSHFRILVKSLQLLLILRYLPLYNLDTYLKKHVLR